MKINKFLLGMCLVLTPIISSCGDGHYRYLCQDPVNWEKQECNPPLCEVSGACWYTLIGKGSQP